MDDKKKLEQIHKVYFEKNVRGVNERYHYCLRELLIPRKKGRSALEVGCGAGDWTRVLADLYQRVDVVDASASLLKGVLRQCKNPGKITIHDCMIEDFSPEGLGRWQHIYITFLLEHVKNPVAILRKLAGLLEENGSIFIAVPNAESLHRVLAYRMGLIKSITELSENDKKVGHRRVYTLGSLKKQITMAGLKIKKEIPVGLKVVNLSKMEKWDSGLIDALCLSGDLAPRHCAYIGIVASLKTRKSAR